MSIEEALKTLQSAGVSTLVPHCGGKNDTVSRQELTVGIESTHDMHMITLFTKELISSLLQHNRQNMMSHDTVPWLSTASMISERGLEETVMLCDCMSERQTIIATDTNIPIPSCDDRQLIFDSWRIPVYYRDVRIMIPWVGSPSWDKHHVTDTMLRYDADTDTYCLYDPLTDITIPSTSCQSYADIMKEKAIVNGELTALLQTALSSSDAKAYATYRNWTNHLSLSPMKKV